MGAKLIPLKRRLEKHYIPEPNSGCWLWLAATIKNPRGEYGVIGGDIQYSPLKMLLAHRASYMVHVGPIEEGLDLDHKCTNTLCINPDHLQPLTRSEHGLITHQRAHKGTCRRGHQMDLKNTWREKNGARHCRRCHADHEAARRVRNRSKH